MGHPVRSACDWYKEAARCYLEGHQACAWCGGQHQVFKIKTATGVEYHCNQCDFRAGYDRHLDRHTVIPGETSGKRAPATMHDGLPAIRD